MWAVGCQEDQEPDPSFAFVRPEKVAFACFDTFNPLATTEEIEVADPERPQLPLRCCAPGTTAEEGEDECGDAATPRLHALITQTRRGEVAAANVEPTRGEAAVIDGDPVVPDFTFTDVGELPAALVVPEQDLIASEQGPRWSYVASAGEREVRAIATCRFRLGRRCGPERVLADSDGGQQMLGSSTRVPLPSRPADMVLDGNGYLWVSLPEQGALGRIRLNGEGSDDAGEADLAEAQPFVASLEGELLELFPLDGMLPQTSLPLVEDSEYFAQCGLGSTPELPVDRVEQRPISQLEIAPSSPLDAGADGGSMDGSVDAGTPDGGTDGSQDAGADADASGSTDAGADAGADAGMDAGPDGSADAGDGGGDAASVQPGRLRYDPESNLLLAADRKQPLIHVWRIDGDAPMPLTSIVTGAPVRDFALTAPVPRSVALYRSAGGSADWTANDVQSGYGEETVRYIYAIDDRNGTVLAIRWAAQGADGAGTAELVKAPGDVAFADRLPLRGVAQALDIIDTRGAGIGRCAARRDVNDQSRITREATPGIFLNGVFVAVAFSDGTVRLVDVHDRNAFCEAFGTAGEGSGRCRMDDPRSALTRDTDAGVSTNVQEGDPVQGYALRRHSPRLTRAPLPSASGDQNELGMISCPEGYVGVDPGGDGLASGDEVRVCLNRDPWLQQSRTWSVDYEGRLPFVTAQGRFEPESLGEGRARFVVASGFDLCARGVYDADTDRGSALDADGPDGGSEDGNGSLAYEGDWLELAAQPPPGAPDDCPTASSDELRPRFRIVEAYRDHLIVEAPEEPRLSLRDAVRCYGPNPDAAAPASGYAAFDVRVRGLHLVTDEALTYLHRVTAAEGGRCVLDPELDERLRARVRLARPGEASAPSCEEGGALFSNPYVAFCPQVGNLSESSTSVSVQVTRSPSEATAGVVGNTRLATLPASVRYVPLVRQLFVVDSADQGLVSFAVRPFVVRQRFN